MRRFLIAVFLVMACATGAVAGPAEDTDSAYQLKDYMRAAQLYRPLAEQGRAKAQVNLGVM